MKRFKTALCAVLVLVLAAGAFACARKKRELTYPDHGYADGNSNSWEQLTDADEVITVNWFADYTAFGTAAQPGTRVYQKILEKTKCRINFTSAMTDDGSQLSNMIAGDKLPDIVTVVSAEKRVQLAEEGYAYPIQTLAEKYAPTLLGRLDTDIKNFYKASDGNIYGLPNHFYTSSDMKAYEEQEDISLLSNGAIVVRKDWLDEYVAYKRTQNPAWNDAAATTPAGFVEMCEWVKSDNEISNKIPTVLLDQFAMTTGSNAVAFLEEYFAVPKEGADGGLLLNYEQETYGEMLGFLNELYRKNLIIDSNFSASAGTIGSLIGSGYPFAFIGSPQMYTTYFSDFDKSSETTYVPVLLTNAAGDAPQLRDLSGNGWLFSMITSSCKQPDRVIKLFDYLMSEEGQALFYGVENETFEYAVRPGESAEKDGVTKIYKYGQIEWKPDAWKDIQNKDYAKYGFMYSNPLVNPMYPRLTNVKGAVLNGYNDYIDYNLKAALTDFTFPQTALDFPRDASAAGYRDVVNKATSIRSVWVEKIPQIIRARSAAEAAEIWRATVAQAKTIGSADVLRFDDVCFRNTKEALGLTYAWPPNDPDSGYDELVVNSIYGNSAYEKEIPADVKK